MGWIFNSCFRRSPKKQEYFHIIFKEMNKSGDRPIKYRWTWNKKKKNPRRHNVGNENFLKIVKRKGLQ